jgi:lipoprotein signal peptidase
MTDPTQGRSPVGTAAGDSPATDQGGRQRLMAFGLLAAVVVLDQTTKWWAWRYAPQAIINAGGTWWIGRPVSGWFSGPVSGPLLDHLNLGLLSLAGFILVRRRRQALVLAAGALMIGGWSSNLLDRLGMHTLTAPGSVRGAVDFIPLGPPHWNVADFVIIGAAALFLVAACARGGRSAAAGRPMVPVPRPRPWWPRRTWVAPVGFVVAVALTAPAAIRGENDVGAEPSRWVSTGAGSHV